MGGAVNLVRKSSPTKGLCLVIHMQVINIIYGQLLLAEKIERELHIWSATDKRGEHTATMVSNREERREHQQIVGVALEERIE